MTRDEPNQVSHLPDDVREGTFIVVAAYNEAACIQDVVRDVRREYPSVVVVDDGSSDDTFEAARRSATHVLRHPLNRGQGAALQTGIEFALSRGAQIIVTFDADGQHRVEDIQAMVSPIARGECEITLGSRFLGGTLDMPTGRRRMLRMAVLFTRVVNRIAVTDAHNGLRAFSSKAAAKIHMTLDGMAHASELLDQVRQSELAFREIPVQIRYTKYSMSKGQSSRNAFQIVLQYILGKVMQ